MTHWIIFTLRGWVAFLAFMNFGTAARCFMDEKFLHSKFFGIDLNSDEHKADGGLVAERVFGFWSLTNGIIFMHCAVFIEETRILGISACALLLYLGFFMSEAFIFDTIMLKGAALYPFAMATLTIFWLVISYGYLKHRDMDDEFDENEILKKRFRFKGMNFKKIK